MSAPGAIEAPDREAIIAALRAALEPLPYVHAMWEGGAAAFGRVDAWSDIDLQVDVDDDRADEVLPAVERALGALSPIELAFQVPQPLWSIHAQKFYRLRGASPFLLVDLAVIRHGSAEKFLEREVHGRPVVHFDKSGVVRAAPIDGAAWRAKLAERVEALRVMFPLFQVLVQKELHRGNAIEALAFYHGYTLRPLVELLRIVHTPHHFNFHSRYIHYELPAGVVDRIERLFFVASAADLAAKREAAEAWFGEVLGDVARAAS